LVADFSAIRQPRICVEITIDTGTKSLTGSNGNLL